MIAIAKPSLYQPMALAILLSGWVSVSLPQRVTPGAEGGLDAIAFFKLGIRLTILLATAALLIDMHAKNFSLIQRRSTRRFKIYALRSRRALWLLLPLGLYVLWAFFSTLWSPLKSVSIGQSAGLASQIALTWMIAWWCDANDRRDRVIDCLSLMLGSFSGLVLACHVIAPESSGLMRDHTLAGSMGVIHPTAAGANASLGLVLTAWRLFCRPADLMGSLRNLRLGLVLTLHVVVLLLSQSRTALAMGLIVVVPYVMLHLSVRTFGFSLLFITMTLVTCLAMDPEFRVLEKGLQSTGAFVARGQSVAQLQAVSGRSEMWQAVWEQFEKSRLIGHGYFVTSQTGKLDVWHVPSNYTAHNVYLQALVSTGIIGASLLSWGFIRVSTRINWLTPRPLRSLAWMFVVWFAGWTITCESMLGPVRTESVLFFVMTGLMLSETTAVGGLA